MRSFKLPKDYRVSKLQDDEKDPELLIKAANKLFKVLDAPPFEKKDTFEGFKSGIKKRGFIECKYGMTKVFLHNINNDTLDETQGYNNVPLTQFLSEVIWLILANFEIIVLLIVCTDMVLNGGLANMLVIGILMFFVCIEENFGKAFWWKIINIAFLFIIALKLIAQSGYSFLGESANYEFVLGDLKQKLFMVFPTIILVELLKK